MQMMLESFFNLNLNSMSQKRYLTCKLLTVMVLAVIVGAAVNLGHYFLPLLAMVAAWGFLYGLKGKVKAVLADERDYLTAGKAARISLTAYALTMSLIGVVLMALSQSEPSLELPALLIVYPLCGLIVLNAVLFKIYDKRG